MTQEQIEELISEETFIIAGHKGFTSQFRTSRSLLQKWLRKKHNIHIIIDVDFYEEGINYMCQVLIYDVNDIMYTSKKSTGQYGDNNEFPTYEEALEFGLQKALELI
jgi:hypothetical protein